MTWRIRLEDETLQHQALQVLQEKGITARSEFVGIPANELEQYVQCAVKELGIWGETREPRAVANILSQMKNAGLIDPKGQVITLTTIQLYSRQLKGLRTQPLKFAAEKAVESIRCKIAEYEALESERQEVGQVISEFPFAPQLSVDVFSIFFMTAISDVVPEKTKRLALRDRVLAKMRKHGFLLDRKTVNWEHLNLVQKESDFLRNHFLDLAPYITALFAFVETSRASAENR